MRRATTAVERFAQLLDRAGATRNVVWSRLARGLGVRDMTVRRWRTGNLALVRLSPRLGTIATEMGIPRTVLAEMVIEAVRAELIGVNQHQSNRCEHPDLAGEGCSACCDACNEDRHTRDGCGTLVGHRAYRCPDCPEAED